MHPEKWYEEHIEQRQGRGPARPVTMSLPTPKRPAPSRTRTSQRQTEATAALRHGRSRVGAGFLSMWAEMFACASFCIQTG